MSNIQHNTQVQRRLKTRHLSMIAIGGCIGTGLFMASGTAISSAGPGGALVAYAAIGLMVYFLMTSLGEMATYLPTSGSFSTYAARFVDPSLGFALGWNYWFNWVITVAADVVIAAVVVTYWEPMRFMAPWAWSLAFFSVIFLLNTLSVRAYGESEYWFALVKVVTVIVFLAVGVLTIFGILGGEYVGLTNMTMGDAPFLGGGFSGQFLTILGVFLIAGFSFQGTELIGITAGESEHPEESIPKAIKQVFWRILIFYILAILVIGLLIPYTSPQLLGADVNEIAKSPFTLVFERAGLAFAAAVMNAVILTSILSAGNSGMYASTRMLYAMAKNGLAYKQFSRTNEKGVPIFALFATAIIVLAIFLLQLASDKMYQYILAASGLTGFIAWLGIAISHYRFRRAYIAQGKDLKTLVYRAKWFPFGPLLALALCILVIIGQDTELVLKGSFDWDRVVITYMGLPVFLGFYFYHKLRYKTRKIPLEQVDLSQDAH
ncbi:Lysine-specific permease [Neisseria animaloris]|uniref:Lysine-specific permease n=2 Tax=Neisseria animaloris TaxID=326522 RepID=A0A1X3CK02_9NEIS|nr:amino acid permease [Neisseria animaloris]MDO5072904.1 amino acid permease [Neisseria animaloris]OSI08010.1 gamma-aminobutyrate permease [Neisseria animaloris]VEH87553.1 Lysine-specific permease [Neisseria animaloris]VEJ22348.1 Lysine-specific permease [Neisseria animaloris]